MGETFFLNRIEYVTLSLFFRCSPGVAKQRTTMPELRWDGCAGSKQGLNSKCPRRLALVRRREEREAKQTRRRR